MQVRDGGAEVALLKLLDTGDAHADGLAQAVGNPHRDYHGYHNDHCHQNGDDDNVADGGGHVVGGIGADCHAPAVGTRNGGVGQIFGHPIDGISTVARLTLTHTGVHGGQISQAAVALGLLLNVLGGDGLHGGVGNGVAVLIHHMGAAVLTDVNGGHNIVEEGLLGYEIDHAHDFTVLNTVLPQGSGHHNGQLSGDLADGGSGDVGIALDGLLEVFTVGVTVAVKQTDAGAGQYVATHHAVVLHPAVQQRFLILDSGIWVAQFRHHTKGLCGVFVGLQLIGYAI